MQSEDAELIGTMCFDLSFTQASPYNYASFFTYFKSNLRNNQKKGSAFFSKKGVLKKKKLINVKKAHRQNFIYWYEPSISLNNTMYY